MLRTGIAWSSDKNIKFRNPEGDLETALRDFVKPRDWEQPLWKLDTVNPDNNGFQNEDLIVWMRTAALPSFRKLYRRIDHASPTYENGLSAGKYRLHVDYSEFISLYPSGELILLQLLFPRISRHGLRGHETDDLVDDVLAWRQESVPGNRLHRHRMRLSDAGRSAAIHPHQVSKEPERDDECDTEDTVHVDERVTLLI